MLVMKSRVEHSIIVSTYPDARNTKDIVLIHIVVGPNHNEAIGIARKTLFKLPYWNPIQLGTITTAWPLICEQQVHNTISISRVAQPLVFHIYIHMFEDLVLFFLNLNIYQIMKEYLWYIQALESLPTSSNFLKTPWRKRKIQAWFSIQNLWPRTSYLQKPLLHTIQLK